MYGSSGPTPRDRIAAARLTARAVKRPERTFTWAPVCRPYSVASRAALGYLPRMKQEPPLVRAVHPELIEELAALLEAEGERELAICVRDVRLVGACGCGDDFCQSIRTAEHPQGQPYGPGHRCVPLLPSSGDLILDVVNGRIVYIEILGRPPLPRRAQPEQGPPGAGQQVDLPV
ncbi:hypothetical protein EV578_105190 [Streptomyces sp. BK205]|nr:hypothetical protein EV578_105190 [Streptomyces sp. BK205]